ncbi:MAG: L-arabinose isomerase [Bacillota bacterium]|jgi:L-arabinose isomerase|nr:L-arabinose isomerase [Bacillota bacterium]HHT91670.1 L-arabinose isomerase [Bacillota bacterium]
MDLKNLEVWFVTGSQHLYGEEALLEVEKDAKEVAASLNDVPEIPVTVVHKPVMTSSDSIRRLMAEANAHESCIGLILWMHTFSPARMWIAGLNLLNKPYVHFHTQYHRDIPWGEIDMDYMNLHQSAHGDREFGFINTRMRKNRKVIVGHWRDPEALQELAIWMRVAAAWNDSQGARIARFGDNMRDVAVTEGNKVSAQMVLGYEVNAYSLGHLIEHVDAAEEQQINALLEEYEASYRLTDRVREGGAKRQALRESARIELGLRSFLKEGGFKGFTTNFEDLVGLKQLPGLAVQRVMKDGYGFGAEGDWKTAALLRAMKVMNTGLSGGTSFMEDYVYHLDPAGSRILGAHMLEVCESIAAEKPVLDVQALDIGGKENPARLIFTAPAGAAICASLIDLGNRFRMVVSEVEVVDPPQDLPKLPVARVLWDPKPNLKVAAESWILAGGAHHSVFSQALTARYVEDYCEMAGIEYLLIDENTEVRKFKAELRLGEIYYHLARGL